MLPSLPLEASGGARGTRRGGGDDFAAAEGAQHTSPGMKVGMEARSLRVRVPSPPSVVAIHASGNTSSSTVRVRRRGAGERCARLILTAKLR